MDYIVNTFTYELEHGGPHVHFLAFILWLCHNKWLVFDEK